MIAFYRLGLAAFGLASTIAAWMPPAFTPISAANLRKVGTMQFRFTSGVSGTLTYSVDGINVTKSITRQVFATPFPSCTS